MQGKKSLFGLTVGADEASARAANFGVDFCVLHFGGRVETLPATLNVCDRMDIKYVLNFEGAPLGWKPPTALKNDLENRPGFHGFMLDEADHMQINAHWPVVDYYGYEDRHYLAETEGLDLFAARQVVLTSLRSRNEACTVAGKSAAVEHLFPIMMHTAARAELNISPKILKETCEPVLPVLREALKLLVGDGDHLVYSFGRWQTRFAQFGGDYPRHEIMEAYIPLTQAGTNSDLLEVELTEL
jgi:hypothetical protein